MVTGIANQPSTCDNVIMILPSRGAPCLLVVVRSAGPRYWLCLLWRSGSQFSLFLTGGLVCPGSSGLSSSDRTCWTVTVSVVRSAFILLNIIGWHSDRHTEHPLPQCQLQSDSRAELLSLDWISNNKINASQIQLFEGGLPYLPSVLFNECRGISKSISLRDFLVTDWRSTKKM